MGVIALIAVFTIIPVASAAGGFDQYGYNDTARIFVGLADGVDNKLDGKVWGDPTYANDRLVMKWNQAWDDCNAVRTPENCAGAWTDNEWNGMVPDGSGEVWHSKIIWVGPDGVAGSFWVDGGDRIWGSYEVLMSQGTDAGHFWETHAIPNGYGAN